MFARIKKSGSYQYLQLVENRRDKGKVSSVSSPPLAAWITCPTPVPWTL